ncbi:helix-turn-helix domain-containing protein [Aeromonas caviae]|uniref:helix-turn-helix domain-containing protein n=1 Tax=Aeromonas caviae TaxID=648 RepID=UPI0025B6DC54|nr:hypothetical protein [Aeromonas caviae]
MMNHALVTIREALAQMPYLTQINNQDEYEEALALMDELVDDYDTNKGLIVILTTSIEKWEDRSEEFTAFNLAVSGVAPGIAVLKTLMMMSQHHLAVADLPELGSKSNVSKLLNAADGKKLNKQQIEALSKRFRVSPPLFF